MSTEILRDEFGDVVPCTYCPCVSTKRAATCTVLDEPSCTECREAGEALEREYQDDVAVLRVMGPEHTEADEDTWAAIPRDRQLAAGARLAAMHLVTAADAGALTQQGEEAIAHGWASRPAVKACRMCTRVYDAARWAALVYLGTITDGDGHELEHRRCGCGSTLVVVTGMAGAAS